MSRPSHEILNPEAANFAAHNLLGALASARVGMSLHDLMQPLVNLERKGNRHIFLEGRLSDFRYYRDFDLGERPESLKADLGLTPQTSISDRTLEERRTIFEELQAPTESTLPPLSYPGSRYLDDFVRPLGVERETLPEKYRTSLTTGGEYIGREQPNFRWATAADAMLGLQAETTAPAVDEPVTPPAIKNPEGDKQ